MNPKTNFWIVSIFFILFLKDVSIGGLPKKQSLAFVIDTTGSMYSEFHLVKLLTFSIVDKMTSHSKIPITKFVFVPFNDPDYGPVLTTSDPEELKAKINSTDVSGGGDCPELCFTGMKLGLDASFSTSSMYVFTDAGPLDVHLFDSVMDKIQKIRTQVTIILTEGCYNQTEADMYFDLAFFGTGQMYELSKNKMPEIMAEIEKQIMSENPVPMAMRSNPAGYGNTLPVLVDSSMPLVSVSVSGSAPEISVIDPHGVNIKDPAKVNVTLSLSKVKMVEIIKPAPGIWTLKYGSSSRHSIKVVAESTIRYEFGFYTDNLAEINQEVVQGEMTHLAVKLFDDDSKIKILQSIKILNTSGSILKQIPVEKLKGSSYIHMYKTKSKFEVPKELFSVMIQGLDIKGNSFERLSSTATMGKESKPDTDILFAEKPKIDRPKNNKLSFEVGETAALYCVATGIPQPKISWTLPNKTVVETSCEVYVIDEILRKDAGNYTCMAKNDEGVDVFTLSVEVKYKTAIGPEVVESKSSIMNSNMGANLILAYVAYQIYTRLV